MDSFYDEEEDFIDFIERTKDQVPDGVFDASEYVAGVKSLIDQLSVIHDIDTEEGRMLAMMNIAMSASDGVMGSISVAYVLTILLSSLNELSEGAYERFIGSMINDVIPQLEEGGTVVPYWK